MRGLLLADSLRLAHASQFFEIWPSAQTAHQECHAGGGMGSGVLGRPCGFGGVLCDARGAGLHAVYRMYLQYL